MFKNTPYFITGSFSGQEINALIQKHELSQRFINKSIHFCKILLLFFTVHHCGLEYNQVLDEQY